MTEGGDSDAFARLDRGLQRWMWKKGWKELRQIQESAIGPILEGKRDVILAAPTAGGKTEAAFLPIVSRLADPEEHGLCICVSPLKALINDQYDRLKEVGGASNVQVTRWHGDVSQSEKKKFLAEPVGVLLITPESLEAQLVRRGPQAKVLFGDLKNVVVDELHAFIGGERGMQLQSLLYRLDLIHRKFVPRVALSATLGDIRAAAEFLRPGCGEEAVCIEETGAGRELRILQKGYRRKPPSLHAGADSDEELGDLVDIGRHLFGALRGSHNLIFANSRTNVEAVADILRRLCEQERVPNEFLPHHGSLSKEFREHAEGTLKQKSKPATIVATTTLEMGIDVGAVRSIAQIGNPPSVASMQQRMGRSGREEGEPAILRVYIAEEDGGPDLSIQDSLRAQTVQSIAMVQLMLDGKIEPPDVQPLHLSTLVQQLLAVIAQHGGVRAAEAWSVLCQHGPFRLADKSHFAALLRSLGEHELITQMGDGLLVLGVEGERIVDHYDFYAAFFAPEEFEIVHASRSLGSLPITKPVTPDSHIIFTGRRWEVVDVDVEAKVISVRPSPGGRPPMFDGAGPAVHGSVRQQMRKVYQSDGVPRFADATSQALLSEGRERFASLELGKRYFVEQGSSCRLFPWCGDRVMATLELLISCRGVGVVNEGITLHARCSEAELKYQLRGLLQDGLPTGHELASDVVNKVIGKYDHFLPEDLQNLNFASFALDMEGAAAILSRLCPKGRSTSREESSPTRSIAEGQVLQMNVSVSTRPAVPSRISNDALPQLVAWARRLARPVTVFDLETTTNNPHVKWMGITELGMLTIYPTGQMEEQSALVNPERSIPPRVTELTGITNQDVKGQPTWQSWSKRLHEFARDHVMIGYNSSRFDCPTVISQNSRYGVSGTTFAYSLDAMRLPGVHGKLIDAADRFGVSSEHYHRAMADVWATARLVEAVAARHGSEVLTTSIRAS